MNRVIMHVDMNAFFASIEQKANPRLRNKPVLVGGSPHSRTVVATASYEAREYGVKTGMPLSEARRLCPQAILVEGNSAKYIDTSLEIIKILNEFTDQVEVFSIDEAFIDVTGSQALFGKPVEIARKIKERLRRKLGLTCSIGIAPNKLLAKLASEMEKPDGLVEIEEEEVSNILASLPVEKLCGIGEKTAFHLSRLGIRTAEELGNAPLDLLIHHFGIIGHLLKQMGRGMDGSRVISYTEEGEVKSMGHSYTLPGDTSDMEMIRTVLLRLSEQVGRRLRKGGYRGRRVTLVLRYSDFFTFSRDLSIRDYIDCGLDIYYVALRILKRIGRLAKAVRLVGVKVSNLISDCGQLYLLESYKKREALMGAIDRINDKFGEFTLHPCRLLMETPCEKIFPYKINPPQRKPLSRLDPFHT
ncbi:MAG: DNA polymerase IV [bacterium]